MQKGRWRGDCRRSSRSCKENAELNNLDNCTFWAGDVLKVIDELGEVPDLIMLDPPRDGVNPKALMKILNFGVERLVYIACKPTSLARDLEMIQGRGYKVEKISGVDLFPGTYHVETICQLVKVEKIFRECIKVGESVCKTDILRLFADIHVYELCI